MSDFLTRLAERILGVAPAVEPKLPPRFAPLAPRDPDREWWAAEAREAGRRPSSPRPPGGEERGGDER